MDKETTISQASSVLLKGVLSSESISQGHPDRLSDTVANTILEKLLLQDPDCHAGLEVLVAKNFLTLAGEVSHMHLSPDKLEEVIRRVVLNIGYTDSALQGFSGHDFEFLNKLAHQSQDINQGVSRSHGSSVTVCAGDQGQMSGYAVAQNKALLPLSAYISNLLTTRYQYIQAKHPDILFPDAKSQVTCNYDTRIVETILMACSHRDNRSQENIQAFVYDKVILPVMNKVAEDPYVKAQDWKTDSFNLLINTTGRFVIHGPASDSGLTGRKLAVDSYGSLVPICGGNTNGKDPSKVDASAARACRHLALNIVAAGLATECYLQVAYAIGQPKPVSFAINTFGTAKVSEEAILDWIRLNYDFSVMGIIKRLDLAHQEYSKVTYTGQFGGTSSEYVELADPDKCGNFSWEQADLVNKLREDLLPNE